MKNPTGFVSIDVFDSSLPESATQKLIVEKESREIDPHITLEQKLLEQNLLINHDQEYCSLRLVVSTPDDFESDYYKYDMMPIATGSYTLDPQTKVGAIGTVYVNSPFKKNGIGTQLKKHINNHLRQDGCVEAFTYIGSKEGRKLARKTGYTQSKIFPNNDDILSNRFVDL